jgi:hypothetical protein
MTNRFSPSSARQNRQRTPPTQYEVFTGGKLPEFAVFYNIAFFRMAGVVNHLLGNKYEKNKDNLEKIFENWLKAPTDAKVFAGLRDYLWKGFRTDKNGSGTPVTPLEEVLMVEMLKKLHKIRNFQSHYYHDNAVLIFSENLKKHILKLHDEAKDSFTGEKLKEVGFYESNLKERPFFKFHDNKHYITPEGKTFFLSFFLTRGEMARFLQQRKGCKRNNSDEFKIKHLIYCYFTHRDGAARQHYGQMENVLTSMSTTEQKEIMSARQAFKLISYLNDVPPVCHDVDLFPLYLDGVKVETTRNYITFCQQNGLFEGDLTMNPLVKTVKIAKDSDETKEVEKEHFLDIYTEGYHFHISKSAFHKLILDAIRRGDKDQKVVEKLKVFVAERTHLYKLLTDVDYKFTFSDTLENSFKEYNRYKLRNEYLQEQFGKWLDLIEKSREPKTEAFLKLLNEKPIEVGYYDFYFEETEKPRAIDMFTRFAVQYLIDFGKVQWQWMYEKFDIVSDTKETLEYGKKVVKDVQVNKRTTFFSATIPEKGRLSVTHDGQVTVGIEVADGKLYKFVLGHRALKNLLIAQLDNKDIKGFFTPIIIDIQRIKKASIENQPLDISKLAILRDDEMPASFKVAIQAETMDSEGLREKAKKRIESIVEELTVFANGEKTPLSRNEKNRQIMRCYTFFDWKYPQDNKFKFLRKDEYQRMSVYHYCLEKRRNPDLKLGNYNILIKDALPHTPDNIQALLRGSIDIDDLLQKTALQTINKLNCWARTLEALKGQKLYDVLGKLSISTYRHADKLPDYVPFDIHPRLVLRKFYKKETLVPNFSLSKKMWEKTETRKGLKSEHYEYAPYLAVLGDQNKTAKKKVIGAMNELQTQDALLWDMAKQYLDATSPAYQTFLQGKGQKTDWKVDYLRQSTIEVPFNDMGLGKVTMTIKFHQLDDYLLVESRDVIGLAVNQAIMRFNDVTQSQTIKWELTKINNQYTIPYEEVFKEIQRVFNDAVYWAQFILAWEKLVVDNMPPQYITFFDRLKTSKTDHDKHINFHEVSMCYAMSTEFVAAMDKLNSSTWGKNDIAAFEQEFGDAFRTLATNEPLMETLVNTRNKAFHADIPADWAFWQRESDVALCQLLNYTPKPAFDYENRIDNND